MKSLYIKAEHVFQEQPELKEPNKKDFQKCVARPFHEVDIVTDAKYYDEVKKYDAHIASLRKIPCRPGDIWQEGVVYEEGKDYVVRRQAESCECGNYFDPYDNGDHSGACWNCNRTKYKDVIIAKKTEPPAPPQSEGELWKEMFEEFTNTHYDINWIKQKYTLSLRSDKPELFTKEQVTQLIREAFIEGFRNNGVPLGEWSDNLEGNEEQLKEFINSKLQPGVKG